MALHAKVEHTDDSADIEISPVYCRLRAPSPA